MMQEKGGDIFFCVLYRTTEMSKEGWNSGVNSVTEERTLKRSVDLGILTSVDEDKPSLLETVVTV
jgi:hypothetical protein